MLKALFLKSPALWWGVFFGSYVAVLTLAPNSDFTKANRALIESVQAAILSVLGEPNEE